MANPKSLVHKDPEASDDVLVKEAADHLGKTTSLQVVSELLTSLRSLTLPWWTPEQRREAQSATERMRALKDRPDVRQRIMVELCGLPPKASRRMAVDMQAMVLDEVLEEDRTVEDFENAFNPQELVVYGDAALLFYQFMDAMPFDKDIDVHQRIVADFITSCLNDKREHDKKKSPPILTHWEVRTAIDPDVWQERIPREHRVAVDRARLELEKSKPHEKFHARHEIEIVGVDQITKHIPLKLLKGILEAAAAKMNFERPKPPEQEEPAPETKFEGRSSAPPASTQGDDSPKA